MKRTRQPTDKEFADQAARDAAAALAAFLASDRIARLPPPFIGEPACTPYQPPAKNPPAWPGKRVKRVKRVKPTADTTARPIASPRAASPAADASPPPALRLFD